MYLFTVDVPVQTPGKTDYTPQLTAYIPNNNLDIPLNKKRPAVIIFPGGAYRFTFDGEAEPIALQFTASGIAAFVMRYSCAPARFPQALCEGLWCIKYVRQIAGEYGIDEKNISVLGFSAGGHLAASVGTLWEQPGVWKRYLPEADSLLLRPDKLVLCYPVINAELCGVDHGTYMNLLGEHKDDRELQKLNSLDQQVTEHTPPVFIWQTFEDASVPVKNSLLFAQTAVERGVITELHIYPHGKHGSCTGDHTTCADHPYGQPMTLHCWMEDATRFMFDDTLLV